MNKAKKFQKKKKKLDEVFILKYSDEGFNYAVNGLGSGFNGVGTSGAHHTEESDPIHLVPSSTSAAA
jgi:hypothetical protein